MDAKKFTLKQAVDHFISRSKLADITLQIMKSRAKAILPHLGARTRIDRITGPMLEKYYLAELRAGKSVRTVENMRQAIGHYIRACGVKPPKTPSIAKLSNRLRGAATDSEPVPAEPHKNGTEDVVGLKFKTTSLNNAVKIMTGEPRGRFGALRAAVLKKAERLKPGKIFLFKAGNGSLPTKEAKAMHHAVWSALRGRPFGVAYSKATNWFGVGREQDMATVKQSLKGAE